MSLDPALHPALALSSLVWTPLVVYLAHVAFFDSFFRAMVTVMAMVIASAIADTPAAIASNVRNFDRPLRF